MPICRALDCQCTCLALFLPRPQATSGLLARTFRGEIIVADPGGVVVMPQAVAPNIRELAQDADCEKFWPSLADL